MPKLREFGPNTTADDLAAVLASDGAAILRDYISPEVTDRVMAEISPFINATPEGRDDFTGRLTTRTGALVARSPACRSLVADPLLIAAASTFLKPWCARIQLHLTQAIRLKPGQPAQMIHRDRWAWGTWLKGIEPQFNTIWALTDFTRENGATQVAPGSVDWPDNRVPAAEELTQAVMPRGSVLVYSGAVFHGGGANQSTGDRVGLNITYALGWLRQEENQYLSCPPEIARTLDPDLQALIGYSMGSYALGYYTPPLPPGAGPEVVPPQHALGHDAVGWGLPNADLAAISSRQSGNES